MNTINISEGLKRVIDCLNSNPIEYMVVGSIAGSIYGEPRLTRDLDLVIQTTGLKASSIIQAFKEPDFYVPPIEVLSQEISQHGQFNLLHNGSGLKIDCILVKATPHSQSEFSRKMKIEILPGLFGWIAQPEDIIIKKLAYYRDGLSQKHLLDIRGILINSEIDLEYTKGWVAQLKLESEWQLVQQGFNTHQKNPPVTPS